MSKKYSDHLNRAIVLLFRSKRFYNKSCSFIPIYNLNTHGSKITEGTHVLPVIQRDDVKRLQRDNYEEHKSPLQSNSIALVFVVSETYFFYLLWPMYATDWRFFVGVPAERLFLPWGVSPFRHSGRDVF